VLEHAPESPRENDIAGKSGEQEQSEKDAVEDVEDNGEVVHCMELVRSCKEEQRDNAGSHVDGKPRWSEIEDHL